MERSEILEMMAALQLSGMRAAYDEMAATGIKRKHGVEQIIGALLKAELAENCPRSSECCPRSIGISVRNQLERLSAITGIRKEASRCVGILGRLARDAGPTLAPPLDRWRLGVRVLTARRRQRGIVRRLRRSVALDFKLGDPGVQRLHLRQQFVDAVVPGGDLRHEAVDPRQQRRHKLGAITTPRINLSLRHGERESARRTRLNTSDPSHNAAEG